MLTKQIGSHFLRYSIAKAYLLVNGSVTDKFGTSPASSRIEVDLE